MTSRSARSIRRCARKLRDWLRRLHDELHVTSIFVTHDQEEAFEVSDRVVVLNAGKIEQEGTPLDVFEHPKNEFVMDFLGNVNKLPVRVEGGKALLGENGHRRTARETVRRKRERPRRRLHPPARTPTSRAPPTEATAAREDRPHQPRRLCGEGAPLAEDFGLMINVDITPDRYRLLALKQNEAVYVTPKSARIFEDYVI